MSTRPTRPLLRRSFLPAIALVLGLGSSVALGLPAGAAAAGGEHGSAVGTRHPGPEARYGRFDSKEAVLARRSASSRRRGGRGHWSPSASESTPTPSPEPTPVP